MSGDARRPKAVLIAGPTASGKSAAALALAARLGGTIINADSMQVYRELAVLTARPTPDDEAMAPHRLYGMVPAREAYSAGSWRDDAATAIAEAQSEGRVPVLVGGTGLYFKVLLEGLAPVPDIPAEIREHWREQAETLGAEGLYRKLALLDPAMAMRLRPSDPQRVARALEVIEATGVSLAEWHGGETSPMLCPDGVVRIVVAPEREVVYAQIDARFDRMVEAGAVEEVRALIALHLHPGLPAMRAHGVRELATHLVGAASLEEAVTKAKTESRRYAKRQMTWLRRFMADWDWFPDSAAAAGAIKQ
ncbi:MAG TPA: tRNA (adenosine(37)-N6)-dimethylallyltransferase MiaA [Methyloceanibacter sp.]|nr:tRNA (adenosine(37)-N6)-dimethylallyltransferase MiaA [Methyloceanibacter sp.]